MRLSADRVFWPLLAIIAASLVTVQILSVRQESQTWDEGFEIVAGYQYLTTGQYRASLENPPLERVLEALPLLSLHPDLTGDALSANNTGPVDVQAGLAFLYQNRIPADRILFAARLPMIAVTNALLLLIAVWTRRRFGAIAGLLSAALFSLDPTVVAHGALVKNDMTVAATSFLAVIAWDWFLRTGKGIALASSGLALGLALCSKYSALFLLPVFLVLYIFEKRGNFSLAHFAKSFAAAGALAILVILIFYAPYDSALLPHSRTAPGIPLRDAVDQSTMLGRRIAWIGSRLGWRAHPYLTGLATFAGHSGGTHSAYILGHRGNTGWWYYFPFAFLVKTPVAILIALAIAIPFALNQPLLAIPVVLFGALSMSGHVDIGLRHILPVYPFLYVLMGAALARLPWRKFLIPAILGCTAIESLAIFPYYMPFFNVLAGGPKNGPKLLVDSNLDWGQDLRRLGEFVASRGPNSKDQPQVCIMYFGTAPTWYYLRYPANFRTLDEMHQGLPLECQLAAVSVTPLEGDYISPEWFAWLRNIPPLSRVGYSIYVWDVHDPAFARAYAGLSTAALQ